MKAEQITELDFPSLFLYDQRDILQACKQFLNGEMSRADFEALVIKRNRTLSAEDEKQAEFYLSGGMGRLGIMDGAPQWAPDFRLEIIRILDGERPKWE